MTLQEMLVKVVELGKLEIGKRYAGPIIGEPDSYRYGDPGWDCSSFVKTMWERAAGKKLFSWAYTDTIAKESIWLSKPVAGCIVLYHYPDSSQSTSYYPHTGIWLDANNVLDARYGNGVGIHPHVTPVQSGEKFRRTFLPKALEGLITDPPPPIPPGQMDPYEIALRTLTAKDGGVLVALRDRRKALIEIAAEATTQANEIGNVINEIERNRPA